MFAKKNIKVAVAIIECEGRYLITQRGPHAHFPGYWEFPGGKQEPGENFETCLVREIREELGVEVTELIPFIVIQHEYTDKNVELHFYFCSIFEGELQPLGCVDFCLATPEELGKFSFPPADAAVVAQLQERGKELYPNFFYDLRAKSR